MLSIEQKLYQVAKHFNDLNSKGKVKGFSANERGYARIKKVVNGCDLLVHHLKNGNFIIDVMVSPTALVKNEQACRRAISIFKNYFEGSAEHDKWEHAIGKSDPWDRCFCDVTSNDLPEIIRIVDELQDKLLSEAKK